MVRKRTSLCSEFKNDPSVISCTYLYLVSGMMHTREVYGWFWVSFGARASTTKHVTSKLVFSF